MPWANGHAEFRKAALEAQQWLALWIEGDPSVQGLAEHFLTLLEERCEPSSALKPSTAFSSLPGPSA